MHSKDPKRIALQINESINSQNVHGLSSLMTENHRFICPLTLKVMNIYTD